MDSSLARQSVAAFACKVDDRIMFGDGQQGRIEAFEDDTKNSVFRLVRVRDDDGRTWHIAGFTSVVKMSADDVVGVSEEIVEMIRRYGLGYELGTAVHELMTSSVGDDRLDKLRRARWFIDREIERMKK